MPVRAVFFDLGEVLLRSVNAEATSRKWELRLGLPEGRIWDGVPPEFFVRADSGALSEEEVWNEFSGTFGGSAYAEEIARDVWWWDEIDEDLFAFAKAIRPLVRLGIISNSWPGERARSCERFELASVFHDIVLSSEVMCAKPDPRIYDVALGRLCVDASEAILVDDLKPNILAARMLGWHGVLHGSTRETIDAVKALL